jgi:peptide/nickel transport system permease protein
MLMLRYLLRRLALAAIALVGVVVVTFMLTHLLPGNPLLAQLGVDVDPKQIAAMQAALGLDKPLPEQLAAYLGRLVHGDLGQSLRTGRPVGEELLQRLPATLELAICAMFLAAVTGIPLGSLAALHHGSRVDQAIRMLAVLSASTPLFWLGLVLVFVLYQVLGVVPSPSGRLPVGMPAPSARTGMLIVDSILDGNLDALQAFLLQLALPAVTLSFGVLAPMVQISRVAMLQVLGTAYIQTARALGLSTRQVVVQDALPNMLLTVLTAVGLSLGWLLSGNVIVESIYAWPGIGLYAWNSLTANDYDAIQGFVLLVAIIFIALNLLIDVLYSLIDPRVRLA